MKSLLKISLFIFLSIYLVSCNANKLVGKWVFVDIYKGKITNVDSLGINKNNSKYGEGVLVFKKNHTFISKNSKTTDLGFFKIKNNILKLKYASLTDTLDMKINYLDQNNLLLYSEKGETYTWQYKK